MITLGATLSTVEMPAIVRVSTQFDKTADASLANITGLSVTVTSGASYTFQADIFYTANTTGGISLAMGGTATATSLIVNGITYDQDSAAGTIRDMRRGPTMTSTLADTFNYTSLYTNVSGTVTVNVGGTLTLRFSQQSATGTSSVLVGSSLQVTPIT